MNMRESPVAVDFALWSRLVFLQLAGSPLAEFCFMFFRLSFHPKVVEGREDYSQE